MAKSIPALPLEQVYPAPAAGINLNSCGDADCGNHGLPPNWAFHRFTGGAQASWLRQASLADPSVAAGRGRYVVDGGDKALGRVSDVFEFAGDPHAWTDVRKLKCQHQRGNGTCDITFVLMSNEHLAAEAERLRHANGILEGPACGACGRRYLDGPEEFALNGRNARAGAKHPSVQVLHKPCRGKKGARFTVSVEHARQQDRSDNLQILAQIVNNAGMNGLRRVLKPAKGAREVSPTRIYDRIFWLERVLLAYERAQLALWRSRLAREGRERHTRIAHDDIVLGVNWETRADRRITSLNCSVSADIASGYVFRIDVDFDPTVDPVALLEATYLDPKLGGTTLRRTYTEAGLSTFTAPLLSIQRLYRPRMLGHRFASMRPAVACPSGRVGTGLASGGRVARSASTRCRFA